MLKYSIDTFDRVNSIQFSNEAIIIDPAATIVYCDTFFSISFLFPLEKQRWSGENFPLRFHFSFPKPTISCASQLFLVHFDYFSCISTISCALQLFLVPFNYFLCPSTISCASQLFLVPSHLSLSAIDHTFSAFLLTATLSMSHSIPHSLIPHFFIALCSLSYSINPPPHRF